MSIKNVVSKEDSNLLKNGHYRKNVIKVKKEDIEQPDMFAIDSNQADSKDK